MKLFTFFVLILAVLLAPFQFAHAQDPAANPRDNACYPGGAMYRPNELGQGCPTEWHWMCGWYLAHYLTSRDLDQMPLMCRSLLLTLPRSLGGLLDDSGGDGDDNDVLGTAGTCYPAAGGGDFDVFYSGVAEIGNAILYDAGSGCTGDPYGDPETFVPDTPDADDHCQDLGFDGAEYTYNPGILLCVIYSSDIGD